MAYQPSALATLSSLRRRGQRPDGPVIVSDSGAWANRNGFFYVPIRELGEDLDAFTGLHVAVRISRPGRFREQLQRLALTTDVIAFDTDSGTSEIL
jgi:hypothetical protein